MLWPSHKVCTFCLIFIFTRDIILSVLVAKFSVLPDQSEQIAYPDQELWDRYHRTIYHWPIMYLIPFSIGMFFFVIVGINPFGDITIFHVIIGMFVNFFRGDFLWVAFVIFAYSFMIAGLGGLMHILEDSLSGKVPLLYPTKKVFQLAKIKTGSRKEDLFVLGCVLLAIVAFIDSVSKFFANVQK